MLILMFCDNKIQIYGNLIMQNKINRFDILYHLTNDKVIIF